MIKFEYKVIKPFTLITNEDGDRKIGKDEDGEKNVSTFAKGSQYVDYRFPAEGITKGDITQNLIDKKYIELVKKTEK